LELVLLRALLERLVLVVDRGRVNLGVVRADDCSGRDEEDLRSGSGMRRETSSVDRSIVFDDRSGPRRPTVPIERPFERSRARGGIASSRAPGTAAPSTRRTPKRAAMVFANFMAACGGRARRGSATTRDATRRFDGVYAGTEA